MIDISDIKIKNDNINQVYERITKSEHSNVYWLGIQDYDSVFMLQKKIYKNI